MVTDFEPRDVEVLGPGRVMLSGEPLLDLAAMIEDAMRTPGAGGIRPGVHRAWPALQREANAARMARAAEQRLLATPPVPAETITVAEAAELLEVHERQVRRRAEAGRYAARKWHGAWVLDRRLVELDAGVARSADVR